MNPWLLLTFAIAAEVIGTLALRLSQGFSRPGPIALIIVAYGVSFWLSALVLQRLPLAVMYAVWSGAGTAVIAVLGIWLFGEPLNIARATGIALIIGGVVVLNLATNTAH